jgi:hypothetical protein
MRIKKTQTHHIRNTREREREREREERGRFNSSSRIDGKPRGIIERERERARNAGGYKQKGKSGKHFVWVGVER